MTLQNNITIFQCFHWYVTDDGNWWNYSASIANGLFDRGFTHVYPPPAFKSGKGTKEPGYAVYDLYDLGEFDQKGTIRTKYGTHDEYLSCIKSFQDCGIKVIADIVLNHRHGADEEELVSVAEVNEINRNEFTSHIYNKKAYTKFNFPGRSDKYSAFKWDFQCFSGFEVFETEKKSICNIQNQYGDRWDDVPDTENGNFDFLMGLDVDFRNPFVREELVSWGRWYLDTTGVDGIRLDAVKHMLASFVKYWLQEMKSFRRGELFVVSEYWKNEVEPLLTYLSQMDAGTQLFDVPLHFNFYDASIKKNAYDLSRIFENTLSERNPFLSVTFVDNHDTQPFQALQSTVENWFLPCAYALILLRESGIPMVFHPHLYGADYIEEYQGASTKVTLEKVSELETLLFVRKELAYGPQKDYFDHNSFMGWVRLGLPERPGSACAVVISNSENGYKDMDMGVDHRNKEWTDCTLHIRERVTTDDFGKARFPVKSMSVSVWIRADK